MLTKCCDGRENLYTEESGMLVDQHLYRKAFEAYPRKGTPIEWSIKQARPSAYYVWHTLEDEKIRPSHAANDGKIFA